MKALRNKVYLSGIITDCPVKDVLADGKAIRFNLRIAHEAGEEIEVWSRIQAGSSLNGESKPEDLFNHLEKGKEIIMEGRLFALKKVIGNEQLISTGIEVEHIVTPRTPARIPGIGLPPDD